MVTIIEELGRVHLPPYTEAKHIEVKVISKKDEEPQTVIMHEDQVALIKMLSRLQKTANIYSEGMNEIWSMIRAYARSEYIQGNYSGMQSVETEQEK